MDDFSRHALVYFATLAVVALGAYAGAPAEILGPLSQGLGVALPTMLGGHALAQGVKAWKTADEPDPK